jgi:hypothetical protein
MRTLELCLRRLFLSDRNADPEGGQKLWLSNQIILLYQSIVTARQTYGVTNVVEPVSAIEL